MPPVYEETDARGFDPDDPDTFIALALKQEIYLGRSLQLAELIQTQFRERVGRKDRGVRQAPYYVTAYSNMPSVLVELGFLTNPKEEDFLHSEQGQDYMSSALFRAFRDYAKQWFSLEAAVQDVESQRPQTGCRRIQRGQADRSTETSASTEGTENTEGPGNGQEAETEAPHHPLGTPTCPLDATGLSASPFRRRATVPGWTADRPRWVGHPHRPTTDWRRAQVPGGVDRFLCGSLPDARYLAEEWLSRRLRRGLRGGKPNSLETALKKAKADPTHRMQKGREIKIGVLVLLGGILLVLGVNYLKGFDPFGNGRAFNAVYDRIDGLAVSNPVVVNGFKVGQVSAIDFDARGNGALMVTFIIEQPNLQLPDDTKARIVSNDLFGTKAIDLIAGRSRGLAQPGDTLPSEIEMGIAESVKQELIPLRQRTDQLIAGVDEILLNLQTVFQDSATQGLPKAFESIQRTMENLENTSRTLDMTVEKTGRRSRESSTTWRT